MTRTPEDRERHVDLLRAVAIAAVVAGHWLVMDVRDDDGELSGSNVLDVLTWSHPLTWLFQVMPVFFLVGGFANGAAITSHRERGGDPFSWILRRTDRLLRPTTPLLVIIPVAALVATTVGVDTATVGSATWIATIPLWFLLAYMAVVVLAPLMHALHRRAGTITLALLAMSVVLADVGGSILELPYVADANYLLFWLTIHQVGFAWHSGLLPRTPWFAASLAAAGVVALVTSTLAGPYEVRMVGDNAEPPTIALLALAATQIGAVLLLWPWSDRWLRRERPWLMVVTANSVVLTMFIWHMSAAVFAAVLLVPSGLLPQPDVGSGAWLALRVPWFAAAGIILLTFVGIFGRIELRRPRIDRGCRDRVGNVEISVGVVAVLAGLLGIALSGEAYHGPGGLEPPAVVAYLVGAAILRRARSAAARRDSSGAVDE